MLATIATSSIEASYMPTPGKLYITNNLQLAPDGTCIGSVNTLYGIDPAGTAGLVEIKPTETCGVHVNFTKLALPQVGSERTVVAAVDKVYNPQTNTFYNSPYRSFMVKIQFTTGLDGCPTAVSGSSEPDMYETYEREHWPDPVLVYEEDGCYAWGEEWWANDNGNLLDGSANARSRFEASSEADGTALNPYCSYAPESGWDGHRCWFYPNGDEPNWSDGNRVISNEFVPALTTFEALT